MTRPDPLRVHRPDGRTTLRVTPEGRLRGVAVRLLVAQCVLSGALGGAGALLLGRLL